MRNVPALLGLACCVAALVAGCKEKGKPAASAPAAPPAPAAPVDERATVLAELATSPEAKDGAPPPAPGAELVFARSGGAVAWTADAGGKPRVVYGGRVVGPVYEQVSSLVLSRDGRRYAYGALGGDGKWRVVVDGAERGTFSQVGDVAFSPDGAHLIYSVKDGAGWHLVIDEVVGPAVAGYFFAYELGASAVGYVVGPEGEASGKFMLADLSLQRQTLVEPQVTALMANADRTRLAAVAVRGGKQQVVSVPLDRPGEVTREKPYDELSMFDYALQRTAAAYVGVRAGARLVVLGTREAPAPAEDLVGYPVPTPDEKRVGTFVAAPGGGVVFRELLGKGGVREGPWEEAESLVYAETGGAHAYAARRGDRWFLVVNGREGPPFDRVVTPVFSHDGKTLAYRARQDGKRFVVIADPAGKTVRQLPAFEQVYPVRFDEGGKTLSYGVKEGRRVAWRVEPL